MQHSKILKREDGSRVKIEVTVSIGSFNTGEIRYNHYVTTCKKGCRKFMPLDGLPEAMNRPNGGRLKMKEMEKDFVTVAEIRNVKHEIWEIMKPA